MFPGMNAQIVTVLFTDLVASAALFDRLGDERADALRREHFDLLRAAVGEHGGREVKSTGDGLMVVFSSAVAAVRCAIAMQRATTGVEGRPPIRVGLHAGEPLPDDGDLYGTTVIVASRLCDSAGPGEIIASDVVRQLGDSRLASLMEPSAPLRLAGIGTRVAAGRVVWAEGGEVVNPPPPEALRPITVVVADDQRLLRAGFRVILDAESDITVVGEAPDGRTAVGLVRRRRPDVVLLDIRMPEMDGLEAARQILADSDHAPAVVMLTTFDLDEYIYETLRIGASGFLLKDTPPERLIDAVRTAAMGDALLAPSITRRLVERFTQAARPPGDALPEVLRDLTPRELDVLRLVAAGLSNGEIAEKLVLGPNTVKTHVTHILTKLGLRDRVQAVVLAYQTGFITAQNQAT
jgi:DNA-binding NarL/FixJ family response regulator/class 3 adenylate cyclase